MGLLDQIAGQIFGSLGGAQQSPSQMGRTQGGGIGGGALLQVAMLLIQQAGGIDGLLARFRQAGMGDQAASWVGNGQNMAIDASAVHQAFGSNELENMAARFGLSGNEVAGGLASLLPQLVDGLTPAGTTEGADEALSQQVASLGDLLGPRG